MKNFFIVLLLFITAKSAAQTDYIYPGNNGKGTLSSRKFHSWSYYIPANTMGVFTLKNNSGISDFDIYVYSDEGFNYKIASGTNYSTKTELITIPVYDYGRYVYISVKNAGSYQSEYYLYPHTVDFYKIAANAIGDAAIVGILQALFDDGSNTQKNNDAKKNVGRASNLIISALRGENLGTATKRMILSEITNALREEYGYGFWGDVLVNFAVGVVDDTYRYYWR